MSESAFELLRDLLACPICHGALERHGTTVACVICGERFPQRDASWLDLLPAAFHEGDDTRWIERQRACDAFYRDLVADRATATSCFRRDYSPYIGTLRSYRGTILDLGGGAGVTRDFLPPGARYVVVEPSSEWLSSDWRRLASDLPAMSRPPAFVRGVGEWLPFRDAAFDSVLAFWTLNHVRDPGRVVAEAARVLAPGGRLLLVLEDMEPRWPDLVRRSFLRRGPRGWLGLARLKLRRSLGGRPFPVQADHIPLAERQLREWAAPFFSEPHRSWPHDYLLLELQRR